MDLDKQFNNNPYATAYFVIDGFKVNVYHQVIRNKLIKSWYINGTVEGKWYLSEEHEESQRFAYITEQYVWTATERKKMKDLYKLLRDTKPDTDVKMKRITFHAAVKVSTILKQWKEREVNKSIELVDSDGIVLFKFK